MASKPNDSATPPSILEQLRVPFPATQVKKNQNNLDYVAIDGYINRLLDVLGLEYSTTMATPPTLELLPDTMKTSTGKRQYSASVALHLVIGDSQRLGVGADVSHDPDKALKTALAEAVKKAAHQFGIALELWDEDHRKGLEVARRAAGGSEQALKKAVFDLAKDRLGKARPSVADVAKVFGVPPGELSEKDTLQRILEAEGVI